MSLGYGLEVKLDILGTMTSGHTRMIMEPKKLCFQFIVPVYNDRLIIILAIKYN